MSKQIKNELLLPSRELDARVAEKIMGLKGAVFICPKCDSNDLRIHWLTGQDCCSSCEFNLNFKGRYFIPKPYSQKIEAAWTVVEKMKDYAPCLEWTLERKSWEFCLEKGRDVWNAEADTPPLAICLAALAAVKEKK